MAIKVFSDRIEFTNYTLRTGLDGIFVTTPGASEGIVNGTLSVNGTASFPGAPAPVPAPAVTGVKVNTNSVEIGGFAFTETPTGIDFSGDIAATTFKEDGTFPFQGTVSGYTSGGLNFSFVAIDPIDKFPFATNANATDVGDLRFGIPSSGHSSESHGYVVSQSAIQRFPFATNANATPLYSTGFSDNFSAGSAAHSSDFNGYFSGSYNSRAASQIFKFPFAAEGAGGQAQVGVLTQSRGYVSGQNSDVSGYTSGGADGPFPYTAANTYNIIDKFPFATDANATDVGNLSAKRWAHAGQSSTTSGYVSGGYYNNFRWGTIQKFPFASDTNASSVANLSVQRGGVVGQSSTVNGYTSGGQNSSPLNLIDKFPFASNATATFVGDLSVERIRPSSEQD